MFDAAIQNQLRSKRILSISLNLLGRQGHRERCCARTQRNNVCSWTDTLSSFSADERTLSQIDLSIERNWHIELRKKSNT
mmetsp:Transcript_621/g.779  ORF Transcript_621/g.779 Transcript_621/m.779 type:complete len:80 (+) Transcript_621:260-499(+)